MNAPEMRQNAFSEQGGVRCDGCPALFTPKRPWQKFCSDGCRVAFHKKKALGPEGRLAELEQQVAELKKTTDDLKVSVGRLEAIPKATA